MSAAEIHVMCHRPGRAPYVMDVISKAAIDLGQRKLRDVELQFSRASRAAADADLIQPWLKAMHIAQRYREDERNHRRQWDLEKIEDAVKQAREDFFDEQGVRRNPAHRPNLANIRKEFAANPPPDELLMDSCDVDRLKASFAYLYDSEQDGTCRSPFAWEMAMPTLCTLKAEAIGSSKTITSNFHERFRVKQFRLKQRMM